MNLHEYQAKAIFRNYGLPVPNGIVCATIDEVVDAFAKMPNSKAVLKCQAHAGGRGKAGGVKVVSSVEEAKAFAQKWLGNKLVTFQTGPKGQLVNHILVEECGSIAKELYIGATIDRSRARIVFMASTEGGTEIEKVAQETPEKIFKEVIEPICGAQPFQAKSLGFKLGLNADQIKQFTKLFLNMYKMFKENDLSLLEVNPLVITTEGNLVCLDAKINIDSNALYRHKDLAALDDLTQIDAREAKATSVGLNYVALDGNIGCMVNGAGLAMGTMDIIKTFGGEPANFLDVGGTATKERVIEAFKIILSDNKVKSILVNIFGGIVRCDLIADGIIGAVGEIGVKVPVVVRLEGNQAPLAIEKLAKSGLNIIPAHSLKDAARLAVESAQ
ncbi:MAG: ADP-forming succinate--CoA ligase subunit beta [Succinivibrio sp.]|nr:ADP-forming succinate--CoA ligase subunit beta [Ruminobacter sp.]MDY3107200.1 ADP-forming succinate--CoA ligase subunit beta [Succinivibrio sp.]MDY5779557.1 ADP-forming succinate--CoA ligase subunit beta [Succinivibrionaceae bacterium]